jgi:hypothetical protein
MKLIIDGAVISKMIQKMALLSVEKSYRLRHIKVCMTPSALTLIANVSEAIFRT